MYSIQLSHNHGKWKTVYSGLTKAQAGVYWKGQSAFNGWKARLLNGKNVIDEKG